MAKDAPARFISLFRATMAGKISGTRLDTFIRSLDGDEAEVCLRAYLEVSSEPMYSATDKRSLAAFVELARVALDRGTALYAVRVEALVQARGTLWQLRMSSLSPSQQRAITAAAQRKQKGLSPPQAKFLKLFHEAVQKGKESLPLQHVAKLNLHDARGCLFAYIEASLRYPPNDSRSLQVFYGTSLIAIQKADAKFLTEYRRLVDENQSTWLRRWARLAPSRRGELERALDNRATKLRAIEASLVPPKQKQAARKSKAFADFSKLFVAFMAHGNLPAKKKGPEQTALEKFIADQKLGGLRECFAAYLEASLTYPADSLTSLYVFFGVAWRLINYPRAGVYEARKFDLLKSDRGTTVFERFEALPTNDKMRLTSELAAKLKSTKRLILDDLKFEYYRKHRVDPTIDQLRRFDPDVDPSYRDAVISAVHACDHQFGVGNSRGFASAFDAFAELLHAQADNTVVLIAMTTWCRITTKVTPSLQSELYWYGVLVLQSAAIKRYWEVYDRGLTDEDREFFLAPNLVPQGYRVDFDRRLLAARWSRLGAPKNEPPRTGKSSNQQRRHGSNDLRDISRAHALLLLIANKLGKSANVQFTLVDMDETERVYSRMEKVHEGKTATADDIRIPTTGAPDGILSVGETIGNLYIVWWDRRIGHAYVQMEGLGKVLFKVDTFLGLARLKRDDSTYGKIWRDNQHLLVVIPAFFDLIGYLPSLVSGGFPELVADIVADFVGTQFASAAGLGPESSLAVAFLAGILSNKLMDGATGSKGLDDIPEVGPKRPPYVIVETKSGLSPSGRHMDKEWLDQATARPLADGPPLSKVGTGTGPTITGRNGDPPFRDRPGGGTRFVEIPTVDRLNGQGLQPGAKPEMEIYLSEVQLRKAVGPILRDILEKNPHPNREWTALQAVIPKGGKWARDNADLMSKLQRVWEAQRDPERILDLIAEIWREAARTGKTTREVLESYFPKLGPDVPVATPLAKHHLLGDGPFRDLALAYTEHGAHTHMFSELLTARALGGIEEAAKFRRAIANSGDAPLLGGREGWRDVWDAIYDADIDDHLNNPTWLGAILQKHLGLPRWNAHLVAP